NDAVVAAHGKWRVRTRALVAHASHIPKEYRICSYRVTRDKNPGPALHLDMQVRPGCISRIATLRNRLSGVDNVTGGHQRASFLQVGHQHESAPANVQGNMIARHILLVGLPDRIV